MKEKYKNLPLRSGVGIVVLNKKNINNFISEAEKELSNEEIDDQKRFLLNHKIEVLKSLSIN